MASLSSDSLSSKHEQEMARLKQSKSKRAFKSLSSFLVIAIIATITFYSLFSRGSDDQELSRARRDLLADGSQWSKQLSDQQLDYQSWLKKRGTAGELEMFNNFSTFLYKSAQALQKHTNSTGGNGIFSQLFLGLHFSLLRISFLIIASWRLWMLVLAFAWYRGFISWKAYSGDDMLGQTGNGRLFYSGIRAGLDSVNSLGAPELQVRGLACPQSVSTAQVRSSSLGKILAKYGVANETNTSLAGIILHYSNWPAYIANLDEDTLLENYFVPANLDDNCVTLLERVMDLYLFYKNGQKDEDFQDFLLHFEEQTASGEMINHYQYSRMLQQALHRVLTPNMREDLMQMPIEQIATVVLAYEAGKTMAFGYEGGKWLRKSNFPQLTARSIMHSVSAYAKEYDFASRVNIRCSLIYGSRYSSFGPVKTPVGLSPQSRAARQWVELLMAAPYELESVADEVEMHGIIREAHDYWVRQIFDGLMTGNPEVLDGVYATPANLFLMPISSVIRIMKRAVPQHLLAKLEELIVKVNQHQRLQSFASEDGQEQSGVPAYARVFSPFSNEEISLLSEKYGISPTAARDWSSLRVVLNSFGWLGRRVGDYSVPESSIIYAVMKPQVPDESCNHLGLLGIPGMVPLRGTRFEEKWGKTWQSRFIQVWSATMAENKEDYEKLLKGIVDSNIDDMPSSANFT